MTRMSEGVSGHPTIRLVWCNTCSMAQNLQFEVYRAAWKELDSAQLHDELRLASACCKTHLWAYGDMSILLQSTTRVKPFICTMPMRLDEGWNQIQFNLSDFTRRAYGKLT